MVMKVAGRNLGDDRNLELVTSAPAPPAPPPAESPPTYHAAAAGGQDIGAQDNILYPNLSNLSIRTGTESKHDAGKRDVH